MSCYAFFKWWLLLSQHPGCLRAPTSFDTEPDLGTLAEGLGCFPFDDEAYPPRSHSHASRRGIRSLVDLSNPVGPLGHPVLYLPGGTPRAAPQCISGRTSYLQARLAFHRDPQLFRAVFNRHRFGPPAGDYPAFTLAMGRSPGFGSTPADMFLAEQRPVRTRFPCGSPATAG